MIPHTVTIADGDQVRIPGGNMLWVYSLGASSGVTGKFYAPDGKQIGTEWTLVQGIKYGPGQSRPDGSFWFQWVDIANNSGTSQTITVFTLESMVDLSGAANSVSIADTYLDASTRQGMLELQRSLSPEPQSATHESIDFSVVYYNSALASSECGSIAFVAKNGGDSQMPHQIYIDRVEYQSDGKCVLAIDEGVQASSSATPISSHSYISYGDFHSYNGGNPARMFPQGVGGSTRRWAQSRTWAATAMTSTEWVDGFEVPANERRIWTPPVPMCIAAYDSGFTYGYQHIYLDNLEASGTNKAWMRVYGRVVPTDTGWTS